MSCTNCDYNKNAPDGICNIKNASDAMVLRCVGGWSKDKHYYLKNYTKLFTNTMKDKWRGLCYIDLFAGPGKCMARDFEEEIDGSPLIVLESTFAKYIFVELNKDILTVLENRCKNKPNFGSIKFISGDCNSQINIIITHIPTGYLSLAFIDPTGLDITFNAVQTLTENRAMDLIINFPEAAIKRNLNQFILSKHCKLDDFIGDKGWRDLFKQQTITDETKAAKKIMEYYRDNLRNIGYVEAKLGDEVLIRSSTKNLPLYRLLFASKHPLGDKFWKIAGQIEPSGQRKLW